MDTVNTSENTLSIPKKITAGIDIKLNNSVNLYHAIQYFVNKKQDEADTNDAFKLRFENVYKTMELCW